MSVLFSFLYPGTMETLCGVPEGNADGVSLPHTRPKRQLPMPTVPWEAHRG